MLKIEYVVIGKSLNGRNIEKFVRTCSMFKSKIFIITQKGRFNAKSMLAILYVTTTRCEKIEIEIIGEDEKLAHDELTKFLKEIC